MFPSLRSVLVIGAAALSAGFVTAARATTFPGALYETFGAAGLTGLSLANPAQSVGALLDAATNVVAGGGRVYFQDGATIYSTSPTLQGLTTVHTNNVAPTGLALDAADDILYETFGAGGVVALNATTGAGIAVLSQSATNIVAGGGKVYFQQGAAILSTTSLLQGVNTVIANNVAPTGLGLDAADGILYETFGAGGIAAVSTSGSGVANLSQPATNIVVGGDAVYFENGAVIDQTTTHLVGVNTFWAGNSVAPAGLAYLPATAVPEPPTYAMMALGLLGLAGVGLRRRLRAARN